MLLSEFHNMSYSTRPTHWTFIFDTPSCFEGELNILLSEFHTMSYSTRPTHWTFIFDSRLPALKEN